MYDIADNTEQSSDESSVLSALLHVVSETPHELQHNNNLC